jgi:hypothetical protein
MASIVGGLDIHRKQITHHGQGTGTSAMPGKPPQHPNPTPNSPWQPQPDSGKSP